VGWEYCWRPGGDRARGPGKRGETGFRSLDGSAPPAFASRRRAARISEGEEFLGLEFLSTAIGDTEIKSCTSTHLVRIQGTKSPQDVVLILSRSRVSVRATT